MSSPEEPKDTLQFDAAEPAVESAALPACAACGRTLTDTYHTVNKALLCEACRRRIEAEWSDGAGSAGVGKALLFGIGGAIAGAALYFGVLAVTGYEIGLIAIAVGYLVGKGVHLGSGGRGGWLYQSMAVALTYCAIVSTYVPMIMREIGAGTMMGPVSIALTAAMLPFLTGTKNLIGLLIIGFALFQAWQMNRRPQMVFAGPFQVKSTTT